MTFLPIILFAKLTIFVESKAENATEMSPPRICSPYEVSSPRAKVRQVLFVCDKHIERQCLRVVEAALLSDLGIEVVVLLPPRALVPSLHSQLFNIGRQRSALSRLRLVETDQSEPNALNPFIRDKFVPVHTNGALTLAILPSGIQHSSQIVAAPALVHHGVANSTVLPWGDTRWSAATSTSRMREELHRELMQFWEKDPRHERDSGANQGGNFLVLPNKTLVVGHLPGRSVNTIVRKFWTERGFRVVDVEIPRTRVGHIDEVLHLVADKGPCGLRLLRASSRLARELLHRV
jgi:hypothetical protein